MYKQFDQNLLKEFSEIYLFMLRYNIYLINPWLEIDINLRTNAKKLSHKCFMACA